MATPEQQLQTMIANFPEKTGKSLEDWIKLAKKSGLNKHGEVVKMLKTDHGMGHGFANVVAAKTLSAGDEPAGDDLIAAQYAGPKAALRPIYDAIEKYVKSLGKNVEIAPKKASVSFRRNKQFALASPATKTRIDLGINLKGVEPTGKLEAWGGMVSHRVRLEKPADLDKDVKAWLKQAYEAS